MRFKLISCQVLTREISYLLARSPHSIAPEILTMGLHDLGASMRPFLQERIDAADGEGYDAILLGYALCGRGTEGLRARKTQIVLPRAHDCIGLLMGSRSRYQAYFDAHPGVYFRSPGWLENQGPGEILQPANSSKQNTIGERRSREELIAQYGEENGSYLFEQFNLFRRHYSGLTYISTSVGPEDAYRNQARAEAEKEGWAFDEIKGSLTLLERLVNGEWNSADFLVIGSGQTVQDVLGEPAVEAI
ncbi:MAG: DUF1638 domain-containing protein [Terracidiphilus sp.]